MTTTLTRRDALLLMGGSAAGLMLSPLPWKLLDDVAIRTQNYPWALRAPRGRQTSRLTRCALCPAGCALRVRSVGGRPFALAPVPADLASRGAACALGLAATQLAYHPDRLTGAVRRLGPAGMLARVPVAPTGAVYLVSRWVSETRRAAGPEGIAVLDGWPGRETSSWYRRFLAAAGGGTYIAAPDEGAFLARFAGLLEPHPGRLGADLERAGAVLSFGAPPLLPAAAPGDRRLLIHAGPRRPAHAALEDMWLPVRPGTEAALALALAGLMVEARGALAIGSVALADREPLSALLARFTPEAAAAITGLAPGSIRRTATRLTEAGPAIAFAGVDPASGPLSEAGETAVALLNVALGGVGRVGGILPRADLPDADDGLTRVPTRALGDVADGSIHLLLLDGADSGLALPWSLVAPKLAPGARVVSFAPYLAGMATRADLIVPSPAPLEALTEIAGSPVAARGSLGLAAPLLTPPRGCREPGEFLAEVAAAAGWPEIEASPLEPRVRRRVDAIHGAARGTVIHAGGGESSEVRALPTADDLWDLLLAGGLWVDAPAAPTPIPPMLRIPAGSLAALAAAAGRVEPSSSGELPLVPIGIRGAVGTGALPPALAKLCRESDLWPAAGDVLVHPDTASALGLSDGRGAVLVTTAGSGRARVRLDSGAMPGVAFLAVGPGAAEFGAASGAREESPLRLCVPDAAGTWRVTPATLREV
jgi:anaerobic selenocysteine-containing dehydrogenase